MEKQIQLTGKRKSARARVFLRPRTGETGSITINQRTVEDYFPRKSLQKILVQPLELTNTLGQYDVLVNVKGGGLSAQASAVRHGLARVLNKSDLALRPALKKAGFLTRDSREVERKKYGLAGARKRFQFSKR